jgi:hypothetical protein
LISRGGILYEFADNGIVLSDEEKPRAGKGKRGKKAEGTKRKADCGSDE